MGREQDDRRSQRDGSISVKIQLKLGLCQLGRCDLTDTKKPISALAIQVARHKDNGRWFLKGLGQIHSSKKKCEPGLDMTVCIVSHATRWTPR